MPIWRRKVTQTPPRGQTCSVPKQRDNAAGQHPQAIADDLGIPYRAVVSRLSLMRVPPLPRSHLVRQYDPAIARERMREAGLIVRECRMQPGRLFFGDRFAYIAPMSKRTINYREMQAGYGD